TCIELKWARVESYVRGPKARRFKGQTEALWRMNNKMPWRIELHQILLIVCPRPISHRDSHKASPFWCQLLPRRTKNIDVMAHVFERMMEHDQIPLLRCGVLQVGPAYIRSLRINKRINSMRVISESTKDIY